ncbi:MAG: glycosyltransferase family 9 protein [Alphaproteobacteria bacterium]|nr:MAG: glycosyltransferase family 9 protein [Alphaproteobacteria bacterium]
MTRCCKRRWRAGARARNAAFRCCGKAAKPMQTGPMRIPSTSPPRLDPAALPARPRILVITLRRLGDVLLTTPLIRNIRRGFKGATVDVLVFRGSDAILCGNPDIDRVLTMAERPSLRETLALARALFRRYDLVVSTQTGDRPTFFALLAGRHRVGMVPRAGSTGARWKSRVHHVALEHEPQTHRVTQLMALAGALGLDRTAEIVCPQGSGMRALAPREPYAVLHANPFYQYKRWTDAGWRALARALADRGLAVVVTQGPDPAERAYLDRVWEGAGTPVTRLALDWGELAALLKRAAVYVGTDTSTTHLAAASGAPTIALYGPTSPRLIGPWPVGGLARPWDASGTIQNRGNVWVVQNPQPCLPCEKLGCEGHLESFSKCLDELTPAQVLVAVDRAMASAEIADRGKADALHPQ